MLIAYGRNACAWSAAIFLLVKFVVNFALNIRANTQWSYAALSFSAITAYKQQSILLRSLFWFFFGVQKRTEALLFKPLSSDKKIFRVLTGSCRGGIMESRRGEKTYSIYPPSAKPKHHRDKVQSIPAVVAEERSGTTASHRKIFSSDDTRLNVPPTLHVR